MQKVCNSKPAQCRGKFLKRICKLWRRCLLKNNSGRFSGKNNSQSCLGVLALDLWTNCDPTLVCKATLGSCNAQRSQRCKVQRRKTTNSFDHKSQLGCDQTESCPSLAFRKTIHRMTLHVQMHRYRLCISKLLAWWLQKVWKQPTGWTPCSLAG